MTDWRTDKVLVFHKMHGLGNDFVVIDGRNDAVEITPGLVRSLSDRQRGVGFDQLAFVDDDPEADVALTFYNADGSVSSACGNATRCIARLEMDARGTGELTLRTERGFLEAQDAGDGLTTVNMGVPLYDWQDIPLAEEVDTLHLPLDGDPVATSMGNPHCTFFVNDADAADLSTFGPMYETHPMFPERTNVQFAQVTGINRIRMRVWERGTGVTLASGTSSCAVAVAAHRRGLTDRKVTLDLDGGALDVDWREDGVWMTGPTTHVFTGHLSPSFLETLE